MRRRDVLAGMLGVASVPVLGGAANAAASASATVAANPGGHGRGGRQVRTGFETLAAAGFRELRGQRVGVISNPTGVLRDLTHEVDVLANSPQVDIVAVFGPEHGFRGVSQAGQGEDFFIDAKTGLPVYNAYNDAARMTQSELVTALRELLGAKLVAYLGKVKETRAVRQWAEGTRTINNDIDVERLRIAYRVARLIVEREGALHASNVQLLCPECGKITRIGHKVQGDRKVRICRKCEGVVDK